MFLRQNLSRPQLKFATGFNANFLKDGSANEGKICSHVGQEFKLCIPGRISGI